MSVTANASLWPEELLSVPRFGRYVAWAGGDMPAALARYRLNLAVAGALFEDLSTVEIVIRNALAGRLHASFGLRWYEDRTGLFDDFVTDAIVRASKAATRERHAVNSDRVVSHLMFGVWVALVDNGGHRTVAKHKTVKRSYERTLWIPHLRHAFPHGTGSRSKTHTDLLSLQKLRNRIAHHEPVLGMDLAALHQTCLKVVGWIDADASAWLGTTTRFPTEFAAVASR